MFLFNLSPDPELNDGDFDRIAEANGEAELTKASKPVRFVGVASVGLLIDEDDSPFAEVKQEGDGKLVRNSGGDCGVLLVAEKIFAPLTLAKGDLEDAYAMKPL